MQKSCYNGILSQKIGIVYASAMRYTLVGVHNVSSVLFASRENDIVSTVYSIRRSLKQGTRRNSTVGLRQATISSLTLFSIMFQAIPMGKCLFRSISIKSWSLLLNHGCWKGMTLHWRKMEIVDMAGPKTTTLFEDKKKKTSWSISSTAPIHLIFLPLRIAGSLLNNISVNILTGTIIPQRSWILRVLRLY